LASTKSHFAILRRTRCKRWTHDVSPHNRSTASQDMCSDVEVLLFMSLDVRSRTHYRNSLKFCLNFQFISLALISQCLAEFCQYPCHPW
jgi:hypothetical protein